MKGKIFALSSFRRRFGLTLVELLLVIGIIAVLAGIVWAALAPVRERARQVQCMNNLKHLHLATMMYAREWAVVYEPAEGVMPHLLGLPVDTSPHKQLAPYLKNLKVYECPNDWEKNDPRYVNTYQGQTFKYSYVACWPWYPAGAMILIPYLRSVRCGQRFVLYFCGWHGWYRGWGPDAYLITCRWNGQIRGHYVRLPMTPCYDPP